MALHKLERRNYGRKWSASIKYQNLNSFKEWLILLCQSILKMRKITHLHGSVTLQSLSVAQPASSLVPQNIYHRNWSYYQGIN